MPGVYERLRAGQGLFLSLSLSFSLSSTPASVSLWSVARLEVTLFSLETQDVIGSWLGHLRAPRKEVAWASPELPDNIPAITTLVRSDARAFNEKERDQGMKKNVCNMLLPLRWTK